MKMEEIRERSIRQTAQKISDDIKNMPAYKTFYNDVQRLVSSNYVNKDEFKDTLKTAMRENGLETELRNTVFHWLRGQQNQINDPLMYLKKANSQWEKRIHKSLNSMCTDLGICLAKGRPQNEQDELGDKWTELSTNDYDLSKYRPVYAPKDFLEVLLTLPASISKEMNEPQWEFSHIPIKVKTLEQLRSQYPEWSRGEPLLGVNPHMPSLISKFPTIESERITLGKKIMELGYAPLGQEFLKKGCPQCLRAKLWSQVLGTQIKSQNSIYFTELKQKVIENDLMIDKLIFKDVQLTASNDDQYFVFEDVLYQVMLCFSRDVKVYELLKNVVAVPIKTIVKGKSTMSENAINFPPSGIIPFHGFTMYATPFCYLYDDPIQLYFTFRAFYTRYWHRLHNISTHPQSIVSLCLLFERLLQAYEPQLWSHFRNLNIEPIRIVFKWIMRAFSGHLSPEQLLLLWDAILGYDSLEILPLLALSIISFRKENIFQVNTIQNVDTILADLSTICVVPLLQLALMRD